MTQTTSRTGAFVSTPNENISVAYGLVKTVEHYLGSVGILDYAESLKECGVPIVRILVAMFTHVLMGSNFMSRCSDWLKDGKVRKGLGLDAGLSQKAINRGLWILVDHSDWITVKLWEGLYTRYRFESTDVNIDGSAVVMNGPESEFGAVRYPRDFRDPSRSQVEFLAAELQESRIPFFIRAYEGNASDLSQYRDALPDIFSMVRQGSWIILDNGGASGDILDSVVRSGNQHLTGVKLNVSDEKRAKQAAES